MDIVFSLLAGLVIAAIVQLMLTNLGIALGLTALDWSPGQPPSLADTRSVEPNSEQALSLTHWVGLGVAVSMSLVLFTASLLTVEFSQIADLRRGSIFGIILWAAYWLVFVWLSSTTLSSIANSILGAAIAGLRRLITALQEAFRAPSSDGAEVDQALVRDLAAAVSEMADLRQSLPLLLAQQREELIAEISDRTSLSPAAAKSVVDELDTESLEAESAPASSLATPSAVTNLFAQLDLPNWRQILQQVLHQVDLSELDVEMLWQRWQSFAATAEAANIPKPGVQDANDIEAVIPLDAEEFVCKAPRWSFHPEILSAAFSERLYDPAAAPEQIREQLASLNRTHFIDWLEARGDLAAERVEAIADELVQVRDAVMAKVSSPHSPTAGDLQPALAAAQEKLTAYCRYTNLEVLTPDGLLEKIETVRQEAGLPKQRPLQLDWDSLAEILVRRQGISSEQQQALTAALKTADKSALASEESSEMLPQRLANAVEEAVRSVDWSAVSLADLQPELLRQLRSLDIHGEPDWVALRTHLQVPPEVKTELVDWLQDTGLRLSRAPRRWAQRIGHSAQDWARYLTQQMAHYLQFQEKTAFQPEYIAQDVTHILKHALRLLPRLDDWPDWEEIGAVLDVAAWRKALEQRRDMTAEDVQQVLDWLEAAWEQAVSQMRALPQALWSEAQALVSAEIEDLHTVRQRVVEQIGAVQQSMRSQAAVIKADLQRQADATRQQVASAAWWLFLSLLASGSAAAIAGWLAVRY